MVQTLRKISLIFSLVLGHGMAASAAYAIEGKLTCQDVHRKAVSACAAHEHAVNADALSIVSSQTRKRVIRDEETKLEGLKRSCLSVQQQCALACDEELETASIDGSDLTEPLDRLNDCRQGQIPRQIRAMNKKLVELRRVMNVKPETHEALKSAANP
ncbi:MAG: hypothetical protein AB7N80_12510 [Bdellovibrionales bacterium]